MNTHSRARGRTRWEQIFPFRYLAPPHRKLVGLMWIIGVFHGYALSQASATLPYSRQTLGMSSGEMSTLLSVARLAGFGALLFAHWGDRKGRRVPMLTAFVLVILAGVGTSLSQQPLQFGLGQSLLRIGGAALPILVIVLLAERVASGLRGFVISVYGAAGSLGTGLGLMLLPLAAARTEGWRLTFALTALGMLFVPLLWRRVTETPLVDQLVKETRHPLRMLLTSVYRTRFWRAAGVGLLTSVFVTTSLTFSTQRLIEEVGLSATGAVVLTLVGGTIGASGFFVGGRLSDLWGRKPVTVAALVFSLAGGVGLYTITHTVWLLLVVTIGSMGAFAYVPAAGAHRTELFPTVMRTTAGTAETNLGMAGSALGLAIGGVSIDRWGLTSTVLGLSVFVLAAIALTLSLPETHRSDLRQLEPPG